MNARKITYWISTALVAAVIAISGVLSLVHSPNMVKAFAHLGYPAYFGYLLGVSKVLGVCVLLVPGWATVKEWAYAGIGITLISACVSHFASGDGLASLEPLLFFVMLIASYLTRSVSRGLHPKP
jgi:DoxX-like protein